MSDTTSLSLHLSKATARWGAIAVIAGKRRVTDDWGWSGGHASEWGTAWNVPFDSDDAFDSLAMPEMTAAEREARVELTTTFDAVLLRVGESWSHHPYDSEVAGVFFVDPAVPVALMIETSGRWVEWPLQANGDAREGRLDTHVIATAFSGETVFALGPTGVWRREVQGGWHRWLELEGPVALRRPRFELIASVGPDEVYLGGVSPEVMRVCDGVAVQVVRAEAGRVTALEAAAGGVFVGTSDGQVLRWSSDGLRPLGRLPEPVGSLAEHQGLMYAVSGLRHSLTGIPLPRSIGVSTLYRLVNGALETMRETEWVGLVEGALWAVGPHSLEVFDGRWSGLAWR